MSDLKKLDSFTLEMSKTHLIRTFLRNGRLRVKCYIILKKQLIIRITEFRDQSQKSWIKSLRRKVRNHRANKTRLRNGRRNSKRHQNVYVDIPKKRKRTRNLQKKKYQASTEFLKQPAYGLILKILNIKQSRDMRQSFLRSYTFFVEQLLDIPTTSILGR